MVKQHTTGVKACRLRGSRRGQSLIVAVIVMFVLLFIGAVFVGLVARNLLNSGRAKETVSAAQFGQAGIAYCDYFLQNSPLGADWRPALTPINNLNPNDPDYNWLVSGFTRVEMTGGRALIRVTFHPDTLLKSYGANDSVDPNTKLIQIESVGRVGTINPNDPTTFLNTPSPRLRREYVAYKDIGLTSNLLYLTNINKDTKAEAFLGVQPMGVPVFMQLGGLPLHNFYPLPAFMRWTGAPMRINAKLHLGNNLVIALDKRNGDVVQVADDIVVDPEATNDPLRYRARLNVLDQTNQPNHDPTAPGAPTTDQIKSSDDPLFTTFQGMLRDSAGIPDIAGYVRSISRLDAPVLDAEDQSTGFTRYRQLTRGSGKYLPDPGNPNQVIDLGRIGLGSGIYVDNYGDSDVDPNQPDSDTLVRTWLDPGMKNSRWNGGPYYVAPGVMVEFGYPIAPDHQADGTKIPDSFSPQPGFRIARSDGSYFRDLLGQPVHSLSVLDFTFFIYVPVSGPPVLKVDCDRYREMLKQAPYTMSDQQIDKLFADFNGVIFAEGNINVHGLVPGTANIQVRRESGTPNNMTDQQIRDMISTSMTLVANNNIYIDSSLVREDAKAMVALLAVQNVVVNTTMFTAVTNSLGWTEFNDPLLHASVGPGESANLEFRFGENPGGYVDRNSNQVPLTLLLRQGVSGNDTTYLNLFINEWAPHNVNAGTGPQPLYYFNDADPYSPGLPAWTHPIHGAQTGLNFEYRAYSLLPKSGNPNNPYLFTGDANYTWPLGMRNTARAALDVNYANGAPAGPYLFGRAAVVPMDVRIEAVMYAQNGRFFIIPGQPINNNSGEDSREQALLNAKLVTSNPAGSMTRAAGYDQRFPLAGEPMDCRITIVGSVSANRTASASEQAQWMKLWGWIPSTYGSTGHDTRTPNAQPQEIPSAHMFVSDVADTSGTDMRFDAERNAALGDPSLQVGITRGIRFVYDPALAMPYVNYVPASDPTKPLAFRYDLSNFDPAAPRFDPQRTLPPIPRLPVCPGFVFNGEVR